ncbi:MAG: 1-acyl-sn-glycerol-3-phosphate acyltransferase [Clostridia bacterium]|nr:1-acyl-sn-glycerol-3-phosphate acyltransferase [Clostridia bacterium]
MNAVKRNRFVYWLGRAVAGLAARLLFRRTMLRNEIKGKKGPFVVIANHQSALDFVNLIGATRTPMTYVISRSFFNTLPVKGIISRMGVIPKQQFQTHIDEIRKMRAVIASGGILAIYPAGLMTEDGLSTPIPDATYRFLQWLGADIYVARASGAYFVLPKWGKGVRPGRTYMDIYKLFGKEELSEMSLSRIRELTDEAMQFDAYEEQERLRIKYRRGNVIEGLENVLYVCPHCHREFTMRVRDKSVIYCTECGYAERCDEYGFLHRESEFGEEVRHVSAWSRGIYEALRAKMERGVEDVIATGVRVQMIDPEKNKFADAGEGEITLSRYGFRFVGTIRGEEKDRVIGISNFASLPFKPGRYFEIQHDDDIYRCYPEDGRMTMKIINIVKIFYEQSLFTIHEIKGQ